MSLGPLYVLLGEMSVQVLCQFLNLFLVFLECSCVRSLCILEIKPFSEVSLANMFSHTVGSLFILMLFSLATLKLFILMRSHLFLSFMFLALGEISVKICYVRYCRFSCLWGGLGIRLGWGKKAENCT